MEKVYKDLKLDTTLTKNHFRQKKYNSTWLNTAKEEDYNEMCDLIELPTTKQEYKYLFTIVDLYTLEFDCRPIKNKESQTVLDAMKYIFNHSKYIKKPYASLSSDNGSEFKSVFNKWLYDENIHHKMALPYRHSQEAVIESLNNQITKLIMVYLNNKSIGLPKPYKEWTEILDNIVTVLNEHRQKQFKQLKYKYKNFSDINIIQNYVETKPKFNIGQAVHYKLERPENSNGEVLTNRFRNGDNKYSVTTRKITKIIYMNDAPYYRYMLEDIPQCSFSEFQLIPAHSNDSTYTVKDIIGKKTEKKKIYYLVWWKGWLKKESTFVSKEQLLEDGLKEYIDRYEDELKLKQQQERAKLQARLYNEANKRTKKK